MKPPILLLFLFAFLTSHSATATFCTEAGTFSPVNADSWNGWGKDLANTRHVKLEEGGLSAEKVSRLRLEWSFGFEGAQAVIGQPSIASGRVFIGVDTGEVYSLDAGSGCVHWKFTASAGVRTAPVIAFVDGGWRVFFGDLDAQVYAVDARSGELLWKTEVEEHPAARITGTPQFFHIDGAPSPDRLFVPVSSGEEGAAGNPDYECCTFRGSVVALDAKSGRRGWKTHTIAEAPREISPGEFGPSGAAVWSAPTVDPLRTALYVGTGDAYSAPAARSTDAIISMDMSDGWTRWIAQDTAGDIWTVACLRPGAGDDCGPDHDFGSPPIQVTAGGRDLLIAGQKSGIVWAHDPDSGAVHWRTALVDNTQEFGGKIIWGGAVDDSKAYFGLGPGGIAAVALVDGELEWFVEPPPAAGREDHPGHDGPLTVSGDVVFSGGWDGVLRALSTETGEVIWQYDTVRDFDTVNGVPASGGSMGAAGPVVAGGRLFAPSGYIGVKNGMPGNVLMAFAPGGED